METSIEARSIAAFPESLLARKFLDAHRNLAAPAVIVGGSIESLRQFQRHLKFFDPERDVRICRVVPSAEDTTPARADLTRESMNALLLLANHTPGIVLVPADLLAAIVLPVKQFRPAILELRAGDEVDFGDVVESLARAGYERVPTVRTGGTFAVRGSLIDVFPVQEIRPLRIDFEDSRIAAVRAFDPATQESLENAPIVHVPPLTLRREPGSDAGTLDSWMEGCLLFHLEDEPGTEALPGAALSLFPTESEGERLEPPALPPGIGAQTEEFRKLVADGWHVVLGMPADLCRRVGDFFREKHLPFEKSPAGRRTGETPGVRLVEGDLPSGYRDGRRKILLVSASDLFPRRRGVDAEDPTPTPTAAATLSRSISDVLELAEGDFVVHEQYGIGIFRGLKRIKTREEEGEYLSIEYRDKDILYVPFDKFHMVQKYVGAGRKPKPHRLGEAAWQKIKRGAQEKIQLFARDLLSLYATREHQSGFAFSKDTVFQQEFEMLFPYDETPDQVRAIAEVKSDMEKPKPMDRLICGDAGFGKTEVALRAAFKATMEGKQVAVVVPTTLLAEQHHQVFEQRFQGFNVTIAELSRFRSRPEQDEILRKLKDGKIDICIGTHRLIQDDVAFVDLWLLVIDEEHRFGVKQKERLKFYRQYVDVISMTATPIPRTLYMSLIGTRDISLIETPPKSRIPIHTEIYPRNTDLVRRAAEKELSRGGQIFYLYNRVETIDKAADWVRRAVPGARVGVAHGQMSEEELGGIMTDFAARRIDILVTTTIIESGLDLPNANTIFISDAERFGLSTLYQLRGRVGRSDRPAFCYLLTTGDPKPLTMTARRRLEAIAAIVGVGGGYRVALEDLTLRGAGNLLGAEQHGVVWEIGFEMYCEMLKNSIIELKGEKPETPWNVSVDLKIPQYIPEDLVAEAAERMSLYRRIARCRNLPALTEMERLLEDRFGDLPAPVRNLLRVRRMKLVAREYLITEIIEWNKSLSVYTDMADTVIALTKKLHPMQLTPRQIEYGLRGITAEVFLEKFLHALRF